MKTRTNLNTCRNTIIITNDDININHDDHCLNLQHNTSTRTKDDHEKMEPVESVSWKGRRRMGLSSSMRIPSSGATTIPVMNSNDKRMDSNNSGNYGVEYGGGGGASVESGNGNGGGYNGQQQSASQSQNVGGVALNNHPGHLFGGNNRHNGHNSNTKNNNQHQTLPAHQQHYQQQQHTTLNQQQHHRTIQSFTVGEIPQRKLAPTTIDLTAAKETINLSCPAAVSTAAAVPRSTPNTINRPNQHRRRASLSTSRSTQQQQQQQRLNRDQEQKEQKEQREQREQRQPPRQRPSEPEQQQQQHQQRQRQGQGQGQGQVQYRPVSPIQIFEPPSKQQRRNSATPQVVSALNTPAATVPGYLSPGPSTFAPPPGRVPSRGPSARNVHLPSLVSAPVAALPLTEAEPRSQNNNNTKSINNNNNNNNSNIKAPPKPIISNHSDHSSQIVSPLQTPSESKNLVNPLDSSLATKQQTGGAHSTLNVTLAPLPNSSNLDHPPITAPVRNNEIPPTPSANRRPAHKRAQSAQLPNKPVSTPAAAAVNYPIPPFVNKNQPVSSQQPTLDASLANASQGTSPPRRPRAPARFSTNGIATTDAPPPSFVFRNLSVEAKNRVPVPGPPPSLPTEQKQPDAQDQEMADRESRYRQDSRQRREDRYGGVRLDNEEDDDPTIRGLERLAQQHNRSFSGTPEQRQEMENSPPPEDLFLNLARSQTPRSQAASDAAAARERRRSRLAQYGNHRQPAVETYTPPRQAKTSTEQWASATSPISNNGFIGDDEPDPHTLNHSSSFLRKQRDETEQRINTGSRIVSNGYPGRPVTNGDRSIGSMIEGDRAAMDRTVVSGHDSGSVVSTSAASTVWDELEDLKSRIKRLEFTGKLPPSNGTSGFSGSSGERPRTGTTTVTTISSSPRHRLQNDLSEQPNESSPSNHPLLHSALIKSKTVLPPEIVKALEAVAADTLSLAQYVGSTGSPNTSGVSAAMSNADRGIATDRQVRRKVDSMCRSLTELCIALSDGRMPLEDDQSLQVIHQHQLHTPFQSPAPMSRADPIERASTALDYRSPSYIGSRIDREGNATPNSASKYDRYQTRRASIQHGSPAGLLSRAEASPSPAPVPHHRIGNRNSMILRQQRGTANVNNVNDGDTTVDIDTSAPYFRAPSRASTDMGGSNNVGTTRPSALYSSDFIPSSSINNNHNNHNSNINHSNINTNAMPLSPRLSHLTPTTNMPHRRHFSSAAASPGTRYRSLAANDVPMAIDPRQQQQQQQQQQFDYDQQQQQDMSYQSTPSINTRLRTASVGGRSLAGGANTTTTSGAAGGGMRRATGLLGSRMEHHNNNNNNNNNNINSSGLGLGRDRDREMMQKDAVVNNNNINNNNGGVGIAAGYRR